MYILYQGPPTFCHDLNRCEFGNVTDVAKVKGFVYGIRLFLVTRIIMVSKSITSSGRAQA